ncbi:glycosyltransferase family 2 protein [Microbacterium hydrocarbonoxydans]|uniref:glycosyltransferase family 2 protein n=1 Tax=Microbacterium hydrocarbonoxydans TaxID=273678 RepID=UPI0024441C13|nr:glycosyltransferase family 2 protein [Microbacterium hydrocarbonoxydans]
MPTQEVPRVGVIVPVYNVAEYLRPCVESILAQTHSNLEVILVDDGSTDASGEMCDRFAEHDRRVRVIHRPNGGLSAARNSGIDAANSPFLLCVDGDDVVSHDHVARLVAAFESPGVDVAVADFVAVDPTPDYPSVGRTSGEATELLDRETALTRLFHQRGVTNSAWAKLYRAELFDGIRYPEGALYEDLPVTYRIFGRANLVALTHDATYFYIQRPTSITAQKQIHRRMDAIRFASEAIAAVAPLGERVVSAARARAFMESVFYISELPSFAAASAVAPEVVSPLREYRREVLLDARNRMDARGFALAAFAGPKAVRALGLLRVRLSQMTRQKLQKEPR